MVSENDVNMVDANVICPAAYLPRADEVFSRSRVQIKQTLGSTALSFDTFSGDWFSAHLNVEKPPVDKAAREERQ